MSAPTIVGFDATHANIGHLPAGQVAGYVTGSSWIVWTRADWDAHPGAVRIDQSPVNTALDETADVLDFENGAATLADIAGWVNAARDNFNKGTRPGQRWPAIYCSKSNVTAVANALVAAKLTDVPLWVAEYYPGEAVALAAVAAGSGPLPIIGFQYSDKGGNGTYDLDVFSTAWLNRVSGTDPVVTGPKVTNITINSARISWNRLSGATSYDWEVYKGDAVIQHGSSAVAVFVKGLAPDTDYSFRVKGNAVNDGWTAKVLFRTATPQVVTGLKVTNITETSARISWNRLEGATSYHWQVIEGAPGAPMFAQGYSDVAVVVTGLTPGSSYSFRVVGDTVDSGWAKFVPFKTLAIAKPYPAPTGLREDFANLHLTWNPVVIPAPDVNAGKNATGYTVRAVGLNSVVTTTNSAFLSGLVPGKSYDVTVYANGGSATPQSATITVTAPSTPAPAPTPVPVPAPTPAASVVPKLGMYQANGKFPTPGPTAWPSGSATNLTATYAAWGQDWAGYGDSFIVKCNANGLVPFVELEPWHSGPDWNVTPTFADIIGGKWDSWLDQIGNSIATVKKPCILTFAHEFNVSGQYPWAQGMTGSGPSGGALTPAEWVQGWKYVRARVNAAANGFALWMWAPNADTGGTTVDPSPWWPGNDSVDIVGIDGYPTTQYGASLGTFAGQIQPTVSIIRKLGWTAPIFISETNLAQMVSSGGESIANFVADMRAANVSGILEFEDDGLPQMSAAQWAEYNTAMSKLREGKMKGFTSFVVKAYQAVKAAVRAYPGGATAVLTIVVALAARLGLHVTANELMVVISVAVAAFGTLVHTGAITKALSKSKEVK